jgi:SAM-dependent methyltransferase
MRDFGDEVFAGIAKYYAKYRAPYPPEIFADIARIFNLDGTGRLLDLGCGPGELAIPLAKYFEQVLAIDPDAGMLIEARQKATAHKISNIKWAEGSSRTLLSSVEGKFRLAVMGQSFHWMDTQAVLRQLYGLLDDNGGVVIIGSVPTRQNKLSAAKDRVIKELVSSYLGPQRRAGKHIYTVTGQNWETELFPSSQFDGFVRYDYHTEISRNIDQVLGNLFSMSWSSKNQLGLKAPEFEKELKQKLYKLAAHETFKDHVQFCMYVLKR